MKAASTLNQNHPERLYFYSLVLIFLSMAAFTAYVSFASIQKASPPAKILTISQNDLAQKYGLRVNLLAVTAADGMVDLRLKMVDGEKARLLLQDKKNYPTLLVPASGLVIKSSEETASQVIQFSDNGGLFVLYPNSGGAVKPGTKLSIVFGNIRLEPVEVR